VLYGLRGDVVQLNEADPLGGTGLIDGLPPQKESTSWYGLYNGNISLVYSPSSHISGYLTYNNAQYVDPNSNDGAVGTFGVSPAVHLAARHAVGRGWSEIRSARQERCSSPRDFQTIARGAHGAGNLNHSLAHIGVPRSSSITSPDPHFFATASYSYLHTTLDTPSSFYNYPAQPGLNYDGAGVLAVFQPNQTFLDPGVPQHLFNVLANYKHESGFGGQANLQVTGPIETTQSGYLNIAESSSYLPVPAYIVANGGYYQSPVIPWQYTLNAAAFYSFQQHYTVKFSIYNLTDRHNLTNDFPFYGNDFLTRVPPRSYDLTLSGKF
jgi:outer membrane receptor protein involved in Fe transport